MTINYFAGICFVWAIIGLLSRVVIAGMGERWKEWETNAAYTEKQPKWLYAVDVCALLFVGFTWYMVFTTNVFLSWVIAALLTLILVKALFQMYKYNEFRAFVVRILQNQKQFTRIYITGLAFSIVLIALGFFYML